MRVGFLPLWPVFLRVNSKTDIRNFDCGRFFGGVILISNTQESRINLRVNYLHSVHFHSFIKEIP